MSENGLTRLSLLELPGCQSERGKQFHHYFGHHLIHCVRGRDPCVYVETTEKMFDRLEQVGECIIARCDALGRLIRPDVTRTAKQVRKGWHIQQVIWQDQQVLLSRLGRAVKTMRAVEQLASDY